MPTIHHPDLGEVPLTGIFAALSDPTRLEIVRRLAKGEVCCSDMTIDASKSALSHHLKVLRQAGIIRQEPSGTQRITSLRREEMAARFGSLLDVILSDRGPA